MIFHQQIEAIFRVFSLADIFGYLLRNLTPTVAVNQRLDSNHGYETIPLFDTHVFCAISWPTFSKYVLQAGAKTYEKILQKPKLPNSGIIS